MWIVREGRLVRISFPSSTMEIRCPMAGVGYRTIASSIFVSVCHVPFQQIINIVSCLVLQETDLFLDLAESHQVLILDAFGQ